MLDERACITDMLPGTYRRWRDRTYACRCAQCQTIRYLELEDHQRHWQIPTLLRQLGWGLRKGQWHCPACIATLPIRRPRR